MTIFTFVYFLKIKLYGAVIRPQEITKSTLSL